MLPAVTAAAIMSLTRRQRKGSYSMSYYLLTETMQPCTEKELLASTEHKYVAVLTAEEWARDREHFDMGIELDIDSMDIHNTKAEVNYDSLTGTFRIPDRTDISGTDYRFAFALDEKGIVFIDGSGRAEEIIGMIRRTKRWRKPSLERFLYDFLEQIVEGDLDVMERYEDELSRIEEAVLKYEQEDLGRVHEIHNDVRKLLVHYEQIIDMAQEFEENENGFFSEENLRYIRLFMNLIVRRRDYAVSIRDFTMQVHDLYHAHLEMKQNRIMTLLTVVTTIFMPLTLIVGWYGMNFRYMPELESPYGYPVVILASLAIVISCLIFFKKKKWL